MELRAWWAIGLVCLACSGNERAPYIETGVGSGDESSGGTGSGGTESAAPAAGAGDDATDEPEGGGGLRGSYVRIPGAIDAIFDDQRQVVYVTAEGGKLVTYDAVAADLAGGLQLGTRLQTVDISPDRTRLLIADDAHAGTDVWLHLIDVESGEERQVNLPAESGESGTYSAVFLDDTHALQTGTFSGSGWVPLRRIDLSDDSSENLVDVRQNTMLALSGDGSTVAFAESNSSGGPFGTYRVANGEIAPGRADTFLYEVGVNRDGTELALPSYQGVQVLDADFGAIGALVDEDGRDPLAAVFNPVSSRLYVAWTGTAKGNPSGSVDAYDAVTLEPLGSVARGLELPWNGNFGLGPGRLKLSADGSVLLVIVADGVRVVPLPS